MGRSCLWCQRGTSSLLVALFLLLLLVSLCVYGLVYRSAWKHLTHGAADPAALLSPLKGKTPPQGKSRPPCPPPARCATLPPEQQEASYRLRFAKEVDAIEQEISRLAGGEAVIEASWAERLQALVEELDPRAAAPEPSSWPYSARIPSMGTAPPPSNGTRRYVCPEVYLGPKYDHPFVQHGMEPDNCSYAMPLRAVVTAVLPASSWPLATTNLVVDQIKELYDVPILVLTNSTVVSTGRDKGAKVLKQVNVSLPEAEKLNIALREVTTPFVFLGMQLAHFTNQSSLERLVRVLEATPAATMAGGAARDSEGRWSHGCLHRRTADYHTTYTLGYYHSRHECMFCDDLLTPFVATTDILKRLPFNGTLQGPAVYREWMYRVQQEGKLKVVCPDVMFFVPYHVTMSTDDWLQFARHSSLQTVTCWSGRRHDFPCASVGISCQKPLETIRSGLLVPPCCRRFMEQYLGFVMDFAEKNNLQYELQSGSNLGAVKMSGYLPWDFDLDFVIEANDYDKWMGMRGNYLKRHKCALAINVPRVYFTVFCPYFFLEFITYDNYTSRQFLPPEYREAPTQILYAGRWTKVPANPGLHARNKLGFNYLKHSSHWRTAKATADTEAKGGYDNPGVWPRCRVPGHHACVDLFPGDGNLPFLRPFLHP